MAKSTLETNLEDYILSYYAHKSQGDAEGMDMAMEGMLYEIKRHTPLTAMLDKADFQLKCPKCGDWTWQSLEMRPDMTVVAYGDCEHQWVAADLNKKK